MEQTTTFDAAAYAADGTARERVTLPAELFDGTVNMPVMHQVVKAHLANQRQGTASTKTRGRVIGGNQKPWKQKGTGRARQGSIRAPHFVGGGTVFGPQPRKYTQDTPRKVRALGRKSAFNARARENAILVIDAFTLDAPKTAAIHSLLTALGVSEKKVLILTDGAKPNVYLSARNLPNAHVLPYGEVSTYHILWSDVVLVEAGALGQALPDDSSSAEAAPAPKKRAARKSAAATRKSATATRESAAATGESADAEAAAAPRKRAARKKTTGGGDTPAEEQ